METQQAPGPGHNLPPNDPEAAFQALEARVNAMVENANRWLNERPEIKTEEEAEKAGDFMRQLRGLGSKNSGELDKARMAANKPHREAIKANDDKFNPLIRKATLCIDALRKMVTAWQVKKDAEIKEQQRKAAEEAERKRQEAEAAAKAAEEEKGGDVIGRQFEAEQKAKEAEEAQKAAKAASQAKAKVGSAYGERSMSLRTKTIVEIHDVSKIPAAKLKKLCDRPYVREALTRALREDLELARALPDEAVVVREEKYAA